MRLTHKVPVQEQEVDKVADHERLIDAALLRASDDEVASEASGLLHLRELRVDNGRAIRVRKRLRARASARPLVVLLPLVDLVTGPLSAQVPIG